MEPMKKDPECVRVVVRCRPLSSKEVEEQRGRAVVMDEKRGEVFIHNPQSDERDLPKAFTFDRVFDHDSTQENVFNLTARPIVDCVLEGYNGTVFAYGQTGTGKTHTMEGQPQGDLRGIIPRAFSHVFQSIAAQGAEQFLVRASFLEIYNEEVRDLLSKDPKNKLELKEDVDRGVYVKDLTSYVVKGVSEMEHVLTAGKKNRSVGATLMNQDSSRSHSIFTIVIESTSNHPDGSRHIRVGKLNLVDLAGSERQSKTGATGDRLKEATKINLSLSALGNVISSLVDSKASYIPYRDSKLTRLLQDSLGGNTKTVMVANLGPADYNYDETISTLRYANRAKNIKNKPKINEDPKDTMLREFQEEIARLKAQLEGTGGGVGSGVPGGLNSGLSEEQMEEIRRQAEQEKAEIQAAKDLSEEEKRRAEKKLEEELRKKEEMNEELTRERQEREALALKLQTIQEKLLAGGGEENLLEAHEAQTRELMKAQQELENRRLEEQRLERELQEKEEMQLNAEEKYASIQEEVQSKTKKIKKLWAKFMQAKAEIEDLGAEFQQERDDMLASIRHHERQAQLHAIIISNFIPPEEYRKIERRAHWDEETQSWHIERLALAGNNMKRPMSAVQGKRPTSAVARAANRIGSDNPRFKGENILGLQFDLPQRTTRDYDEREMFDDGGLGFSVGNIPNVYLAYPSSSDMGGFADDGEDGRPKSRTKAASSSSSSSSSARPSSARRKSRKEEKPLAMSEPPPSQEADFPKARGLVSEGRR